MAPPGEDPLRPGPRSLFPLDTDTNVPGEVVDLLRTLGQASNDAALAVVDAEGQFAQRPRRSGAASHRSTGVTRSVGWPRSSSAPAGTMWSG